LNLETGSVATDKLVDKVIFGMKCHHFFEYNILHLYEQRKEHGKFSPDN